MGKSAQKNPPGKSPGKSSKIYTTKILQHISADWGVRQEEKALVFLVFPWFSPKSQGKEGQESLTSESLALESRSRGESQCRFSLPLESLPSESLFSDSHRRNPCFRNSHLIFSRIQAPLNQTPLRLPPIKPR